MNLSIFIYLKKKSFLTKTKKKTIKKKKKNRLATSYAIVKVLLPVRIILSIWATPWFARNFIIPLNTVGKRFLSSTKPSLPARRL